MTPNCSPLLEVVGHVQVGYGIFDDRHLVEVTELKRNPLKGEKRTETFKVPVSTVRHMSWSTTPMAQRSSPLKNTLIR